MNNTSVRPETLVPALATRGGQEQLYNGPLWGLLIRMGILLLLLGGASWMVLPTSYVAMAGISTQGTVQSLQDCGSDGSATAKATIEFRDRAGQTHLASTPWCANYVLNESVSIRYLSNNPSLIITERDLGSLFAMTGLIAAFDLVLLTVFITALWQRLKARSKSLL
jgi:hypothetical protein